MEELPYRARMVFWSVALITAVIATTILMIVALVKEPSVTEGHLTEYQTKVNESSEISLKI